MARSQTSGEVHEYVNIDTGATAGAYAGTEQDKVLRDDPDYERVTRRAAAKAAAEAAARDDGDGEEMPDLSSLDREQLNELAAGRGVEDPASLPNKDAVREAIVATYGDDGDGEE